MGLAASQGRFLGLTARKNAIGFDLMKLSNQKMALTRDMQAVTKQYQESLNSKVLKWSNNSGVTYQDLSYSTLMHPSELNKAGNYMITDKKGRIVLDKAYKKYAEMISPDGSPNGDWESNRTQILSELTGIDASKIDQADLNQQAVFQNQQALTELLDSMPQIPSGVIKSSTDDLLSHATVSGFNDFAKSYGNNEEKRFGSLEDLSAFVDRTLTDLINSIGDYFGPDKEKLHEAFDKYSSQVSGVVAKDGTDYVLGMKDMMDVIFTSYYKGETQTNAYDKQTKSPIWYDINSQKYQDYKAEYDAWEAEYETTRQNSNDSVTALNTLMTADEEAQIKYYDNLFSSIAEQGWTYNENISDSEYLNNMLQNNMYTITTVEREDATDEDGNFCYKNRYNTDIASNCKNVFAVSDDSVENAALTNYEYLKGIISAKEARIDTRMKRLETEQSAISQMLQGIESVMNKNIETYLKTFA